MTPFVGRVSGTVLTALADLLEQHGSTRLRTTPHQKLVLLDISEEHVESLITALDALGLAARPSLFRRSHHRVHRHRVLQARHRRDQADRHRCRARTREAPRRPRPAAADQPARQRMPELLRPHPDRRHRPQGSARSPTATAAGARLPGAPRRRARLASAATKPASAAPCGASRSPPTTSPTTSSASSAASSASAATPRRSPTGRTAPTRRHSSEFSNPVHRRAAHPDAPPLPTDDPNAPLAEQLRTLAEPAAAELERCLRRAADRLGRRELRHQRRRGRLLDGGCGAAAARR